MCIRDRDLGGILNDLNRGEIARLDAIIEQANKAKAQCLSAIAANEKIIADYCLLYTSVNSWVVWFQENYTYIENYYNCLLYTSIHL